MANPDRLTRPRWRRWSDASVLAFIGFGFIIAPEPSWAAWFYVVVMPLGAWNVWRGWRPDWRDPRLMLLLGLIVWSTLAVLWADQPRPPAMRQWLWVWNGLCTATFLLSIVTVAETTVQARDRLTRVLVACAAGNAAFSIAVFLLRPSGWDRLQGWGETRQAILGASIMGMCVLLAIGQSMRCGRWWPLWAATVPLFLAFVLMTGSRGPLLALLLSGLVFLNGRALRVCAIGVPCAAASVAGVWLWRPAWIEAVIARMADRGTSYRLDIWKEAIAEIARRPIFGHGPTATLKIDGSFGHHPHDLYLSAWFYSGAVGLILLLAALVWILRDLRRLRPGLERRTCLALVVHAALSGLTDLSQITKGPGELWYIIWLPLGFALAALRDPALTAIAQTSARIRAKACATVAARIAPRSPGKIRRSLRTG